MLVDPATGLPLDAIPPAMAGGEVGTNFAAGAARDMYQGYGGETGAVLDVLSNWPRATGTAAWNSLRASNTILGGGWGSNKAGAFSQNNFANPKTWGRLGGVQNIDYDPSLIASRGVGGTGRKPYTPLNAIAPTGNFLARQAANRVSDETAARWGARLGGIDVRSGDDLFSRGTLGRVSAARKLWGSGGSAMGATQASNIRSFIRVSDTSMNGVRIGAHQSGRVAGDLISMSARGAASQYLGGFASGVYGGTTKTGIEAAIRTGTKGAWLRGVGAGANALGRGGLMAQGGRLLVAETGERAGMHAIGQGLARAGTYANKAKFLTGVVGSKAIGLIPGLQAVGIAMTVYDLSQMAISAVRAAPGFAKDSIRSFKGQIEKPIMGMGYQDTETAATSRQRGVMAIQNSRLNARSILGSEAAPLAAHFG